MPDTTTSTGIEIAFAVLDLLLTKLSTANLTDEQKAQLRRTIADYDARIARAERAAGTPT